jgi:hypothetical protein
MSIGVVILVVTVTVLVLMLSMPTQGSPPFDPFLPYADLLSKDQMFAAVRSSEFSCTERYEEARMACSFKPDDGVFFEIFILIKGDRPEGITFQVKEDALRVGDLAALWGKPDATLSGTALWLKWDSARMTAIVPSADRLNHFAPVRVVSFTF